MLSFAQCSGSRSQLPPNQLTEVPGEGEIETAMIGPEYEPLIPRIPVGRMGSTDKAASVMLQLSGTDFGYVTGAEIFLTGGRHLFRADSYARSGSGP